MLFTVPRQPLLTYLACGSFFPGLRVPKSKGSSAVPLEKTFTDFGGGTTKAEYQEKKTRQTNRALKISRIGAISIRNFFAKARGPFE